MTGPKNQPIPDAKEVAAAAEKLRQARLADRARRGEENAVAAGREKGRGRSPGEGDPVADENHDSVARSPAPPGPPSRKHAP